MCVLRIPIDCEICKVLQTKLWPLGNGVCDRCLVNNFTLAEALDAACACLHDEIRRLYLEKPGEKKPQGETTEYSGPHFGNAPLPDDDW